MASRRKSNEEPAQRAGSARGRGRPRGRSKEGEATRGRLRSAALAMIAERGFEATTLRDIAREAGVSPGLLYRYFPSKRAVVLSLHDELSARYAARADEAPRGPWSERALFALETSLAVLGPHRDVLRALTSLLVSNQEDGVLSPQRAEQRRRVERVFVQAVAAADAAPDPVTAARLGRLLYLAHLGVILFWLLDRSTEQSATGQLVATLRAHTSLASLALGLPFVPDLIRTAEGLCSEALLAGESLLAAKEMEP